MRREVLSSELLLPILLPLALPSSSFALLLFTFTSTFPIHQFSTSFLSSRFLFFLFVFFSSSLSLSRSRARNFLSLRYLKSLSSQPRFYASRFRSSFALVFLRFFCFARLILLLPLCPVFLSCAGISCCNASPARSCNSERKRYFYADPTLFLRPVSRSCSH